MRSRGSVPEVSSKFEDPTEEEGEDEYYCMTETSTSQDVDHMTRHPGLEDDSQHSFIVFAHSRSQEANCADEGLLASPIDETGLQSSDTSAELPREPHMDPLKRQGRLLLVSLLENFCSLYDKNREKNHKLFLTLCRKLSSMGILESTDFVDEAANIRTVYKRAFRDLVFEAVKGIEATEEGSQKLLKQAGEDDSLPPEDSSDSEEGTSLAFNELLLAEKSRYVEDFIEVCCLGKGGYGRVFKAQNKLDGRMYAIKKIRFSSIYSIRYQRIVREVKSLALMDHQNIVSYNSAWIEKCTEPSSEALYLGHRDSSVNSLNVDPTLNTLSGEASVDVDHPLRGTHLAMYIQMELCQYTLADWLNRRNSLFFGGHKWDLDEFPVDYWRMVNSNIAGSLEINAYEIRRIFKGIVKGLQYIHSQGLIHRDLKPHNIFLYGPDHIPKIGDFGLVSNIQHLRGCEFSPSLSPIDYSSPSESHSNLTSGLGTRVYGSPEQLSGSEYDSKSDIYSLGIICFELFHPFKTHMERSRGLADLKKEKKFPTDFLRKWPKEAAFIWCCLAKDPANRPSVEEILECELLEQDLEEHFLRLSEDNEDLREMLRAQFEENERLKLESEMRAQEAEELKVKVATLETALRACHPSHECM